jgi:hypothetical protein
MVRHSPILAALATGALVVAGCGSSSSTSSTTASTAPTGASASSAAAAGGSAARGGASPAAGRLGFEGVPIEAGTEIGAAATTGTGDVDGITCGATEQLAYHIHAHLQIYVGGQPRALPGGIGIPGSTIQQDPQAGPVAAGGQCIYWLHTHAPDGVIHVESPTARIYTLGNFFDEWHQPLSANRIGNATGTITAFVGGKLWKRNPRLIPLTPHAVIQIDVGQPTVAYHALSWSATSL